jgi:hypothetical protein
MHEIAALNTMILNYMAQTDVTALHHLLLLRRLRRMVEPKESRGWALMQSETSTMKMEELASQQLAVPL